MVGWVVGWLLGVVGWWLVVIGGWLLVGWLLARKRENNNTQSDHKSYTTPPEVLLTLNLTLG